MTMKIHSIEMEERYALYGAGWEAERFYYQFKERDKIDFVIDAYKKGTFHGLNIYRLENVPCDLRNHKVIIATEIRPYYAIRKLLEENGYHNYVWSKVIYNDRRKIVVIHANCHGLVYKNFLLKNHWFNEHYRIIETLQVQEYNEDCFINGEGGIPVELLEGCDVYIHQDIRAENKFSYFLSDDYILPQLKSGCQCITVPNLVGMGRAFYPTAGNATRAITVLQNQKETPFFEDALVDSLYLKYRSLDKIVQHLTSDDGAMHNKVKELFAESMDKLKKREEKWDVKISDFILKKYRDKKLFYDNLHPTPFLMKEICKRLGRIIGLEEDIEGDLVDMGWNEMFVYPFVKNALELKWEDKVIRKNNVSLLFARLAGGSLDIREYVRQYVWWKYDDLLL